MSVLIFSHLLLPFAVLTRRGCLETVFWWSGRLRMWLPDRKTGLNWLVSYLNVEKCENLKFPIELFVVSVRIVFFICLNFCQKCSHEVPAMVESGREHYFLATMQYIISVFSWSSMYELSESYLLMLRQHYDYGSWLFRQVVYVSV